MLIQVVKSKIHRVRVTQAELNYIGSITIDERLMQASNIVEGERVQILSVRLGNEAKDVLAFEYLDTESESFAAYADARANRRDPFFNIPAGGADICNIPVPIRRKAK
jgi:hypothetical protein